MTIPQLSLLGFAIWTILVPLGAVGYYRWTRIFAGKSQINQFPADASIGADWYRRAMRAHANCVENLPVFASFVLLASLLGPQAPWFNTLSLVVLAARLVQSSVHMLWVESVRTVSVRFSFFMVQLASMLALATGLLTTATHGLAGSTASASALRIAR